MSIVVVNHGWICIATYRIENDYADDLFEGSGVEGLFARREDPFDAIEELDRRTQVLAEWLVDHISEGSPVEDSDAEERVNGADEHRTLDEFGVFDRGGEEGES